MVKFFSRFRSKPDLTKARPVPEVVEIIENVRYSSMDAKCIAQGAGTYAMFLPVWYWLMQTNKDNFFVVFTTLTYRKDFSPRISTVPSEAKFSWYLSLKIHEVSFQQAFPEAKVQDV